MTIFKEIELLIKMKQKSKPTAVNPAGCISKLNLKTIRLGYLPTII